jgi:hypothetical protein
MLAIIRAAKTTITIAAISRKIFFFILVSYGKLFIHSALDCKTL